MSKIRHTNIIPPNHLTLDEVSEYNKKRMGEDYKLKNSIQNREDFNNKFKIEDRQDVISLEKIFFQLENEEIIDSAHLDNYMATTSDEYVVLETNNLIEKYPELNKRILDVYEQLVFQCKLCGYSKKFLSDIRSLFK